ncbi:MULTISPECIES: intradiol ring-cleavage dioxygenase [Pseudomonas]|jgi:protocatechuate 3,4-dioxygenase beta subunit|uniref:Intradiol ring-cleavage dioxygenase n=1 Tax=Pseudomonas moraviensis TaxID=321662 RepID=A0A2A2PQB9_9PSED|nr:MULTISPECIES: intradiol ring-cleavage dioxygenase [Pseudomonas]PAW52213.1 intradiol ring-cleavage dioxygenase [Pseudomonas moraviensis]PAW57662.1 intradiol ring-cleavage dioxygenase [Pseudomonas moraviensis]QXE11312.1 intradiol ring-cleavage dioxygenase [Pseudomonas sp. AN-B15]ULN85353.1 intradiol ring-cleavage dioxygenase [Pseudomonas sp. Y5-11]
MERDISAATPQPVYQLAPEQIAGPYFRNPKLLRRNISEGAEGLPLLLRLTIVDAMTGEPVSGALVDIWHCNARGAYSGWSRINPDREVDTDAIGSIPRTDDDTYLRGSQFCDQQGRARFTTIYPGFYAGRALHIHVAVRMVTGREYLDERNVAWVGQLYFPEVVSRAVLNARDYRGRASAPLNNAEDSYYANMGGEGSTLTVWPIGRDSHEDGFFGQLTIGIDTFAASSQIKPEDFDKYTV